MSTRKSGKLLLTERAIADLIGIEAYSVEQWGKRVASRYVDSLESALQLIRADPDILLAFDNLPKTLRYYRAEKHLIVCDVAEKTTVVLTIIHASMDIANRLSELLPQLRGEIELLHQRVRSHRRKK